MSGRMSDSSTDNDNSNNAEGNRQEGLAWTSQNAPNIDDSGPQEVEVVEEGLMEGLHETGDRRYVLEHESFTRSDKLLIPVNFSEEEAVVRAEANRRIRKQLESETSTIDRIGGLGEIMTVVWNTIRFPLDRPEACRQIKPSRGLIIHGMSGVGKTMLIKALVEGCGQYSPKMASFAVEVINYYSNNEDRLAKLFNTARRLRPSVIFLDMFDILVPLDSPNVRTLGALMDALDDSGSVFVVAATDKLDRVDPEIMKLGRFDTEILIDLPNLEARKDILTKMTRNWGLPPSVIDTAAEGTPDFTGGDLSGLCRAAFENALDRTNSNFKSSLNSRDIEHEPNDANKVHVNMEDVLKALRAVQSTKQLQQN